MGLPSLTTCGYHGRVRNVILRPDRAHGACTRVQDSLGVYLSAVATKAEIELWRDGVTRAEADWTRDFGGEQCSLGRAFYTHFEEGKSRDYFASATTSDRLVERWTPGLQNRMLALMQEITSGTVRRRHGWCGAGVHIFPAGEKVAREGGIKHFDTEGLPEFALRKGSPALSLVLMLDAPESGGGIRLWDVLYSGSDTPSEAEDARHSEIVSYAPGDAVVFSSYRLHQIQPFSGSSARVSATLHALEVSPNCWETWF